MVTHVMPHSELSSAVMHDITQFLLLGSETGQVSLVNTYDMSTFYSDKVHRGRVADAETIGTTCCHMALSVDCEGTLMAWDLNFHEEVGA